MIRTQLLFHVLSLEVGAKGHAIINCRSGPGGRPFIIQEEGEESPGSIGQDGR